MRPFTASLVADASSLLLMAPVAAVAGPANQTGSATARASHTVSQPERSLDKKKDRHKGRKGKKKKKHADATAAVSATWTLRRTYTAEPENWEEITFTIKDGSATLKDDKSRIAWGDGKGTIGYHGHYYTDDRSWHAGCDTELRDSTASWSGKMEFAVFAVNQRRKHGEEQKFNGWAVEG